MEMQNQPRYKIGEKLFLKQGVRLEEARSRYLQYFPMFLSHRLYASNLDQKVLYMKPLEVVNRSYFISLNEYCYDLKVSLNDESITILRLESFLTPPIVSKIVDADRFDRGIEELKTDLTQGSYIDKVDSAKTLKEKGYNPENEHFAIPYFLYNDDFFNLIAYREKAVVPLLEYLFVCSDVSKVPGIFAAFKQIGEPSIAPLLHLFTVPNYEHRHLVYYVLGEIGNLKCIEYFEAMKQREDKCLIPLNKGLERLKARLLR